MIVLFELQGKGFLNPAYNFLIFAGAPISWYFSDDINNDYGFLSHHLSYSAKNTAH